MIALAHGAGAGMDTPFLYFFATDLANRGFQVARFEFPYMASFHRTGKRKPPHDEPVLPETWLKVMARLGAKRLVIAGKTLGGRVASLITDRAGVLPQPVLLPPTERLRRDFATSLLGGGRKGARGELGLRREVG